MVNFSKNTYIFAEYSINQLQSKINDKKAYIKKKVRCHSFIVHKMIETF